MMYRPIPIRRTPKRTARYRLSAVVCAVVMGIVAIGTLSFRNAREEQEVIISYTTAPQEMARRRLLRSEIPPLNVATMVYRELFNDTNDTQLRSAMQHGIRHSDTVLHPEYCPDLVRVESTPLYVMDTMRYSTPYLVPEAQLLLQHIATRFQEVMHEHYPHLAHTYRPVVTSCFRTQDQVRRLVSRNRNASANSCHCYGTTLDISYIRFLRDDGLMCNELFLKQMLAKCLYELRYEGLCWVKYERGQSCFHLTLRNIEYRGRLAYDVHYYTLAEGAMDTPATSMAQTPQTQDTLPRITDPNTNYLTQ